MKVNWRSLKSWFTGGLVAAPIAYFVGTYVFSLDPRIPAVERCISESPIVIQHVGRVEKLTIRKRLIHIAPPQPIDKPSREYWFRVRGDKGKVTVRARIHETPEGTVRDCQVIHIYL